jgi:acetyl-CoA C-acetyltransferase
VRRRFGVEGFSQFSGAEQLARRHGLDRGRLDAYALQSHQRAHAAETAGAFAAEKLAVGLQPPGGEPPGADRHADAAHERDEGVRADTSAERLAALQPITPGSVITAGNASQISDGASAVLVASEQGLRRLGRAPLARVVALDVVGGDPVVMLDAPIAATARVLRKAGLALGDIDLFEVNEAFACVPLAWLAATGADPERLNVHGGAIALGHPLGATGTRLTATLVHALHRRRGRYGLQTLCEGGGMANALVLEALL